MLLMDDCRPKLCDILVLADPILELLLRVVDRDVDGREFFVARGVGEPVKGKTSLT